MISSTLFADAFFVSSFLIWMQQLKPITVNQFIQGRICEKLSCPLLGYFDQTKQSRPFWHFWKQLLPISSPSTRKCPIPYSLNRKQHGDGGCFTRLILGQRRFAYRFKLLDKRKKQFEDNIFCGHEVFPSLLSYTISIENLMTFVN